MPEYSNSQRGKFEECALQYNDAMEWLYKERAFRVVPLEELLEYCQHREALYGDAEGRKQRIIPIVSPMPVGG